MRIVRPIYSDDTELHIWARHRVAPREVEAAVYQKGLILRGRAENVYNVFGQTESGRYLTVIVRNLGDGVARLITARDMSWTERRRYERHTAH
jgi:uncharacterized DUF497 family protein